MVFVNTRRLVERVAHQLSERMGDAAVVAHHGSLSRTTRLAAEEKLKLGEVKVCVATASLELGIDIGVLIAAQPSTPVLEADEEGGVPLWVWIVGGVALAAAAASSSGGSEPAPATTPTTGTGGGGSTGGTVGFSY